ncbi:MAG: hypothetical protein QNJ92_18365 [Alphaproteobacteria bacterium]|nr:hypothetical protein [Alphaproteobacteria bacterium]
MLRIVREEKSIEPARTNLGRLDLSHRMLKPRPSRQSGDRIDHLRKKLIANLEEQITLVRKVLNGEEPTIDRRRGNSVRTVRPRLWWHKDPDGHIATYTLYNQVALPLSGNRRTIEVGPLDRLPSVLETVIAAVKAGELDQSLEAADRDAWSAWKA